MSLDGVALLRALPEPHLLLSARGEVRAANPPAARLLGLNEARPVRLAQLVTDPPERVGDFLSACSGTTSPLPGAFSFRSPGGEVRRIRCKGAAVRAPGAPTVLLLRLEPRGGAVEGFRLLTEKVDELMREVDERRRAEEELQHAKEEAESASQAKSQFLAIMSHELRTPLTAIIGYADLIASDVWGPTTEQQRVQIQRIKSGAWHLVSVIEEILTYSRTEMGKEELRLELADLARIVRESAELLEPQARTKAVALRVSLPATPVELVTDAGKVRQIVLNLLGNAIKFTDAGQVEVSLERAAAEVVLRVRDTGPGIAADQVERVFQPFTQLDQSHTRVKGGTGLGLTVCRRLAQVLGGEVDVEESRPGEGSTFVVRLPVWSDAAERVVVADPPAA